MFPYLHYSIVTHKLFFIFIYISYIEGTNQSSQFFKKLLTFDLKLPCNMVTNLVEMCGLAVMRLPTLVVWSGQHRFFHP